MYPEPHEGRSPALEESIDSRGVGHAIDYSLKGTRDAHLQPSAGSHALEAYSDAANADVTRFVVCDDTITRDELTATIEAVIDRAQGSSARLVKDADTPAT